LVDVPGLVRADVVALVIDTGCGVLHLNPELAIVEERLTVGFRFVWVKFERV
jgi:hypothetical protein